MKELLAFHSYLWRQDKGAWSSAVFQARTYREITVSRPVRKESAATWCKSQSACSKCQEALTWRCSSTSGSRDRQQTQFQSVHASVCLCVKGGCTGHFCLSELCSQTLQRFSKQGGQRLFVAIKNYLLKGLLGPCLSSLFFFF